MTHSDTEIIVRPAQADDAAQITEIYNHYVVHSAVTFEEQPVTAQEIARRMLEIASLRLPWLVAERHGVIAGYAYATRWRVRSAYRFSVESTVYVRADQERAGVGTKLYAALLPALKDCGMHVVMGGITLPNDASVRLHENFGFRKVAHFIEVGFKFNRWIDVGYWQRVL